MHHGPLFALLTVHILVPFHILDCAIYPSIQWTPQNPLFDRNDTTLNVLPMSQVHVVCPNPSTVVMKVQDNTPKDRLYHNLWIVPREGHRHCNTNHGRGSRLLLRCNTPLTLKYFTLVFRKYSAAAGALVFKPGREYYLIATSDGSQESLSSQSGGNCKHKNMKLKVYVCLNMRDPRCNPRRTSSSLSLTGATTTTTATATKAAAATTTTTEAFTTKRSGSLRLRTSNSTTHAQTEESDSIVSGQPSNAAAVDTTAYTTRKLITESSRDPEMGKQNSLSSAVSQVNWIVMIPLITLLLFSFIGNIILAYRLRLRQQRHDHKIKELAVIGHLEQPIIQSRLSMALSLCKQSADITEL